MSLSRRGILAGALSALAAFGAGAGATPASQPISAVDNSVGLSYLKSSLYYIEPGNINGGNYLDWEHGDTQGAKFSFAKTGRLDKVDNLYFYFDYQWSEGRVAYSGYFIGGPPYIPTAGRSRATIQQFNYRFGKGFVPEKHWMLTPFIGLGRRYWLRELGLGTTGDYNEAYSFWYYTLGGMAQYAPTDSVVLTARAELGKTDSPRITASLQGTGINDTALGSETIQRYGAEVDYKLIKMLHAFAGFDYEYFTFNQSAVTGAGYYEPFSKTKAVDYALGLRLSFENWHPLSSFSWGG